MVLQYLTQKEPMQVAIQSPVVRMSEALRKIKGKSTLTKCGVNFKKNSAITSR